MRHLGTFGGFITAAILLASCSTAASVTPADTLAALNLMDGVGFHSIDEGLRGGSKIDAQWLGKTKNARIAVAATTWPEELQPKAKAFVEASGKLVTALEKDDAPGASAPAKEAHEAQHELSHDAYNYLATKAGLTAEHPAAGH